MAVKIDTLRNNLEVLKASIVIPGLKRKEKKKEEFFKKLLNRKHCSKNNYFSSRLEIITNDNRI